MQTSFLFKSLEYLQKFSGKSFSFLHLFSYLLHILNCRSVSKLSLNWGHELLQAAGDFFKRKEIHFENAETWQRGQRTAGICSNQIEFEIGVISTKEKCFHLVLPNGFTYIHPDVAYTNSKLNSTLSLFEEKVRLQYSIVGYSKMKYIEINFINFISYGQIPQYRENKKICHIF